MLCRLPVLVCLLLLTPGAVSAASADFTLEVKVKGERLEGLPLAWSNENVQLLKRDGQLVEFPTSDATDFRKSSVRFQGFSAAEMRSALTQELGGQLEVTGTGHYLVAHPKGQGEKWAERFEELYRSFVHYFSVRGFRLEEPKFPLVAIVWYKQGDFMRYASSQGLRLGPGILGFYSPTSNRVTLFDSGAKDWKENSATIIHEATHQTAFNTGVHSRFGMPPYWVAEGLGTLYEARGIWDSRNYTNLKDRINQGRLKDFRQYLAKGRPSGAFMEIVASDRLFQAAPGAAYAEAWALTFFLQETEPSKYVQYLKRIAALPKFGTYSAAQRISDFTAAFGDNPRMLEASYLRFIEALK